LSAFTKGGRGRAELLVALTASDDTPHSLVIVSVDRANRANLERELDTQLRQAIGRTVAAS
jgi:hypothetical protein